ncbi:MAG: GNAT family N-acetyltransferase [Candidatus Lokiarchaeota archaeon]
MGDPVAQYMAAFIPKNPSNRSTFNKHWQDILNDEEVIVKSIIFSDQVIGHIAKFNSSGKPHLTYWIGKKYWGKGITTQALKKFLEKITIRPIYARAAKDNSGSIRVLEKCGFILKNYEKGYANARNDVIEEIVMQLKK